MRKVVAILGGLSGICLLTLALGPAGGGLLAPRRLAAQEGGPAAAVPAAIKLEAATIKLEARSPSALDAKLNKPVTVEFVETPLRDALAFLAESSDVQFYVKQRQLGSDNITQDDPISISLKNVPLSTVLDLMLEQLGLSYCARDEVLIITSPYDADTTMEVRVYDCRDLLKAASPQTASKSAGPGVHPGTANLVARKDSGMPPSVATTSKAVAPRVAKPIVPQRVLPQFGGGMGGMPGMAGGLGMGNPHTQSDTPEGRLIELLETTVDLNSWQQFGGDGDSAMYNGLLVVRQSRRVHAKVEQVLNLLQEASGLEPTKVYATN